MLPVRFSSQSPSSHIPSAAETGFDQKLDAVLTELRQLRALFEGAHQPYYTVEEFARLTHRSAYTIRRWLKEGKIDAVRVDGTGPRGRLLIPHEQVGQLTAAGMGEDISAAVQLPLRQCQISSDSELVSSSATNTKRPLREGGDQ